MSEFRFTFKVALADATPQDAAGAVFRLIVALVTDRLPGELGAVIRERGVVTDAEAAEALERAIRPFMAIFQAGDPIRREMERFVRESRPELAEYVAALARDLLARSGS